MKGKRAGPSPGRGGSEEYDVRKDCYIYMLIFKAMYTDIIDLNLRKNCEYSSNRCFPQF